LCLEHFENSLEELTSYAEKNNVLIAIEYEPGLLIENSKDVLTILSNGFKNVGLNLDVCHAAVLGENITQIIKEFRKKIFHTHISDCKDKKHYHLIPGLGSVDFKAMYNAFQEINYEGFLTVELYTYAAKPEKAAKVTLNYLRKLVN